MAKQGPTYQQVHFHPEQYSNLEVANALIKHSTHKGQLDLKELAGHIQETARVRASKDEDHIREGNRVGSASDVAQGFAKDYNLAARQALGLLGISLSDNLKMAAGLEAPLDHNLVCNAPSNVNFKNIGNSMQDNGVVCTTKPGGRSK